MANRESRKKIGRLFWGVILAGLAAMWLYGAMNPSQGENPLLFAFLGGIAAIGSGFCLFPKTSTRIATTIDWLLRFAIVLSIVAGIATIIAGAPIAAAIIAGAWIVAAAISESDE